MDAVKAKSDNPPKLVGLFADQPLEEVQATVHGSGVGMVQLCGAESIEFCDEAPVPVFRAIHVRGGHLGSKELEELELRMKALRERGHLATLDREVAGLQGTQARPSIGKLRPNFQQRGSSSCWQAGLRLRT